MKHFSLKVWFLTTCAMLVGATALWALVRVLKSLFGSLRDAVIWFLAHLPNFKSAAISICVVLACVCGVVICFYLLRCARALALRLEAKVSAERILQ